jgi:hypothetical protein
MPKIDWTKIGEEKPAPKPAPKPASKPAKKAAKKATPSSKATVNKMEKSPLTPTILAYMFGFAEKYAAGKKRWKKGCTEPDYKNWLRVRDAWAEYQQSQ